MNLNQFGELTIFKGSGIVQTSAWIRALNVIFRGAFALAFIPRLDLFFDSARHFQAHIFEISTYEISGRTNKISTIFLNVHPRATQNSNMNDVNFVPATSP